MEDEDIKAAILCESKDKKGFCIFMILSDRIVLSYPEASSAGTILGFGLIGPAGFAAGKSYNFGLAQKIFDDFYRYDMTPDEISNTCKKTELVQNSEIKKFTLDWSKLLSPKLVVDLINNQKLSFEPAYFWIPGERIEKDSFFAIAKARSKNLVGRQKSLKNIITEIFKENSDVSFRT